MATAPNAKSAEPKLKIQDVITMTARLAQLMAEEVDLLGAMKVGQIDTLQQEKLFLISALDAHHKLVLRHPELLKTISPQDRKDLEDVVRVFNGIMEENHRKLLLAREVNKQIVQAITDEVRFRNKRSVYDGRGYTGAAPYETLSVTLNKQI